MTSSMFKLNLNDFTKGLLMAVAGGALVVIYQAVQSCGLSCVDYMQALNAGIVAGIAYLIKNFFTDESGKLGGVL